MFWSHTLWRLQLHSFCITLLYISWIMSRFIRILQLSFLALWRMSLVFWWKLHWVCELTKVLWPSNRWAGAVFLFYVILWFLCFWKHQSGDDVNSIISACLKTSFFFSSISKVNIAGYNILGWPIVISFWTLNRPYHSLLAYKDFAKKVCCLLVCWGRVGELLNMIWWFSLCLEFCLGIFIVRD